MSNQNTLTALCRGMFLTLSLAPPVHQSLTSPVSIQHRFHRLIPQVVHPGMRHSKEIFLLERIQSCGRLNNIKGLWMIGKEIANRNRERVNKLFRKSRDCKAHLEYQI